MKGMELWVRFNPSFSGISSLTSLNWRVNKINNSFNPSFSGISSLTSKWQNNNKY